MIKKAKITIKRKLTIIKTTMITMHDRKGEFLLLHKERHTTLYFDERNS